MNYQQALEVARVNGEECIPTVCLLGAAPADQEAVAAFMHLSKTDVLQKWPEWMSPR